jgi:hypothetical protein
MLTGHDAVLFVDKITDMIALWRGKRRFGAGGAKHSPSTLEEQYTDKSGVRYTGST